MKKLFLVMVLALALGMSCAGLAWANPPGQETLLKQEEILAGGLSDSGSLNLSKMSRTEIRQLLADAPKIEFAENELYVQRPVYKAPYVAGKLSDRALQATLARLNALRRLAGLPGVMLDGELSEKAQHGAVINAVYGTLSHAPKKPSDMDEGFYQLAYEAASSSNLSAGRLLTATPDGFMDDSSVSNIDRVGHRRWQLNPNMGKIGFGHATTGTGFRRYTAEWSFDRSGAGCDYNFIAWPASGSFPADLFAGKTAWSVTLNPLKYQTPSQSGVIVRLTRESDGRVWIFAGEGYKTSDSGIYFNVENSGYGVNNCIIFRPDGVSAYDGVYTVNIEGLQDKQGQTVGLNYQVDFFGLNEPDEPELPKPQDNLENQDKQEDKQDDKQEPEDDNKNDALNETENPFIDVRDDDYFKNTVLWAVKRGITNGTAPNTFEPNVKCSNADILTMLWRAYGEPEADLANPFRNVSSKDYFYQPALWAYQQGMVSEPDFAWSAPCTRGATMRYIWIAAEKMEYSGSVPFADVGGAEREAIGWAWSAGIANGTTATTFEPEATCTRAEIATFLYRAFGGAL